MRHTHTHTHTLMAGEYTAYIYRWCAEQPCTQHFGRWVQVWSKSKKTFQIKVFWAQLLLSLTVFFFFYIFSKMPAGVKKKNHPSKLKSLVYLKHLSVEMQDFFSLSYAPFDWQREMSRELLASYVNTHTLVQILQKCAKNPQKNPTVFKISSCRSWWQEFRSGIFLLTRIQMFTVQHRKGTNKCW